MFEKIKNKMLKIFARKDGDGQRALSRRLGFFMRHFLAGIFRGMGFALGFFLLSALALYLLNMLVDLGIPVIGDFIAQLLVYIESVQRAKGLV